MALISLGPASLAYCLYLSQDGKNCGVNGKQEDNVPESPGIHTCDRML